MPYIHEVDHQRHRLVEKLGSEVLDLGEWAPYDQLATIEDGRGRTLVCGTDYFTGQVWPIPGQVYTTTALR